MFRTTSIILLLGFGISAPLWASSGTAGASFLAIPVGAGPAAMGSAYTALATDAYAPTWNPGGLGFVSSMQLAAQHLSYVDSINYEYGSFVYPLSHHNALGVSLQYLGTGDIPGTEVGGAPTGNFSSHFAAYSLAYGQALTDRLSVGLTGKLINAQISDVSADAFAVDAGTMYKLRDNLTLAAALTNLGSKLNFLDEGDALPLTFHLGAAYELSQRWLISVEGVFPKSDSAAFRVGAQWHPWEALALRVGYRTDTLDQLSALAGFSTGIGLKFWGQELSYAWVPLGDLGNTNYLSLLIKFGNQGPRTGEVLHQEAAPAAPVFEDTILPPPPTPTPPVENNAPPPSLERGAPEGALHPR